MQWGGGASWSFSNGASAEDFSLEPGKLVPVRAVVLTPNRWGGSSHARPGAGIVLLLEGARDKRGLPGGGLFVEHLIADLQPHRRVIEAHVARQVVAGADAEGAAFGVCFPVDGDWLETAAPTIDVGAATAPTGQRPKRARVILAVDDSGSMRGYIGAARDAVRSILGSVAGLADEVLVTVYFFNTKATVQLRDVPVAQAANVERGLFGDGGTALNDTVAKMLEEAPPLAAGEVGFLGVVTDGDERDSCRRTVADVNRLVSAARATGRWTCTFAGAGSPLIARAWARDAGFPDGNVALFEASERGFRDVSTQFDAGADHLSCDFSRGKTSSDNFFGAAARPEGRDHPVLVAEMRSGERAAYAIDRCE